MNFSAVQNIVNSLVESMEFVNMYGEIPLDKETLEKFHTLQSQLKREFDALDIEIEFINRDSVEAVFYLKKLDEYLYKPVNAVKEWLIKPEELVQRRNILIERLKNENEEPVIVRYNAEIFQQVMTFRYDIGKYADSIIAGINKLHQIFDSSNQGNTNKPDQKERVIKESELKKYFKQVFQGAGNSGIDYFTEHLLPDLRKDWNDKDFARIANMIYSSGKLNPSKKPSTFTKWYRIFCELVGCGFHKYKPSALEPNDSVKSTFYYL